MQVCGTDDGAETVPLTRTDEFSAITEIRTTLRSPGWPNVDVAVIGQSNNEALRCPMSVNFFEMSNKFALCTAPEARKPIIPTAPAPAPALAAADLYANTPIHTNHILPVILHMPVSAGHCGLHPTPVCRGTHRYP